MRKFCKLTEWHVSVLIDQGHLYLFALYLFSASRFLHRFIIAMTTRMTITRKMAMNMLYFMMYQYMKTSPPVSSITVRTCISRGILAERIHASI